MNIKGFAAGAVLALAAAVTIGGCERVSDEAFGARVRAYLLKHPEVLEETINQLQANRAKAAIDTHRMAIERDPRDFVANPGGKITVTEFYDYNCTFCKAAAPQIMTLIRDNPDVRFVFKEYPVLNADSQRAAALALAARDSGKYLALYQRFFSAQGHLDADGMRSAMTAAGINPATVESKAISPAIREHLMDTQQLAHDVGIEGTPNFVVGDQIVVGGNIEKLTRAINQARRKS